ncbi:MAG: hypothetical protein Q9M94_00835 [Candidatus Gracilibacteria bacterium]|nr:hypothetical protein [Candidatus Gracilibacteria bacterium]MDQ7023587.1 hypothetical protein [Candidatus Gracilibacteria bacterium]
MINKKAFSVREIIIFCFILLLLLIIFLSYWGTKNNNIINVKTQVDLEELNKAIGEYFIVNNSLVEVNGNKRFYDKNGDYIESRGDYFGVSGFIGNEFLSKKYIGTIPFDKRLNRSFAYGKTKDEKNYQISGVINKDGKFYSKVIGNYNLENGLYGLIREYNGPNFIVDNSKNSFAYNPLEKKLIKKMKY